MKRPNAYVFDTETTGMKEPVVVESGLLAVAFNEHGALRPLWTDPQVERFNPGKPIECGAWATHFISNADVENARPASEFALPEGTEYIIGHNVDYDWEVIGKPDVKRICTLALARSVWPDLDSHKQLAIVYALSPARAEGWAKGAHSAGADVQMCGFILWAVCHELDVESMEELWEASERARIPTRMPFGKHKGMLVAELPSDYVKWLRRQTDVDPYLTIALGGK